MCVCVCGMTKLEGVCRVCNYNINVKTIDLH